MADYVVCAGYCEVRRFLDMGRIRYVNRGIYGWNFDVWFVNASAGCTIAICEGYRNMPGTLIPSALIDEYKSSYFSALYDNSDFADFIYNNWLAFDA